MRVQGAGRGGAIIPSCKVQAEEARGLQRSQHHLPLNSCTHSNTYPLEVPHSIAIQIFVTCFPPLGLYRNFSGVAPPMGLRALVERLASRGIEGLLVGELRGGDSYGFAAAIAGLGGLSRGIAGGLWEFLTSTCYCRT